jgi:hypothetical protein
MSAIVGLAVNSGLFTSPDNPRISLNASYIFPEKSILTASHHWFKEN